MSLLYMHCIEYQCVVSHAWTMQGEWNIFKKKFISMTTLSKDLVGVWMGFCTNLVPQIKKSCLQALSPQGPIHIYELMCCSSCHGTTSLPLLHPPLTASDPFCLHSAPTLKHTCTTYATASHPLLD